MTAVVAYAGPTAVHLLTDGALLAEDGTLQAPVSKPVILGSFPAAWVVRGACGWTQTLFRAFYGRFHSFDEFAVHAPAVVRRACEGEAGEGEWLGEPLWLTLAGWSESRGRPELYHLVRDPAKPLEGWTAARCPMVLEPYGPALHAKLAAAGIDPGKPGAEHQHAQHGLRIMRAQRELTWHAFDPPRPVRSVGAFCQLTMIGRDGVLTRVLERWPDRVGQVVGS